MTEWIKDDDGNKCSVEYFGSKEAAQKALDSLKDCNNCTNCSDCSDCSYCSRCSRCSRCSDCSRCSRCSDCSDCSNIAGLVDKKDLKGDSASTWNGPPSIPTIPQIHLRILEAVSASPKALDMSTWHTCKTTHCRAGWVVHLAGDAGYELERFHNTALAAQLIYRESNPDLPVSPVRFYETNEEALADMKRMAALEGAQQSPPPMTDRAAEGDRT